MPRFCISGFVVAIAIAWIASLIHRSGHAPLGLVSIGIGVALGAALGILAATLRVAGHRNVLVATLTLALIAIIAQHAWLYANFRREWREGRENSPQVKMFRDEQPWSPWDYMTREATPQRVTLWCIDAALITATALGTVWTLRRRTQKNSASRPTSTLPMSDT
jgi:ABC-type uncharacterized transport system permease subunit